MIKLAVGILTHNVMSFDRLELLKRTTDSVVSVFGESSLFIVDNGSWDGTNGVVARICEGTKIKHLSSWDGDGTYGPGRGRNFIQKHFLDTDADVFVCSDDDVVWRAEAAKGIAEFWSEAPAGLAILSGLLEPEWSWNTPRGVVEAGGRRALVRDSAPAAAWSYRRKDVDAIYPLRETLSDLGEDYAACVRLREAGRTVAQMDLAEHIGWGKSTHGNNAVSWARPLDRSRWGV